MARATQPVMIDDIEFDALISEERSLEAEVPEYAVEEGYYVSDAILIKPEEISMVLYLTDTPVTWAQRHGVAQGRVAAVLKDLEDKYFKKEPVTITTSEATYTDMAISTISISKTTDNGYAREIPITFRKVIITSAETTTIPDSYGKSGATQAAAGTASTAAYTGKGSSSYTSSKSSKSSSSGSGSGSGSGGNNGSVLFNKIAKPLFG